MKTRSLTALIQAMSGAVPEPPRLVLGTADDPQQRFDSMLHTAMAAFFQRDYPRARVFLERCLELRPGDSRVLRNLESIRRYEEVR
ncbi:MAG TPA: hypothetical protein VF173_31885 [Thermoanaerobaculia bacterium]|nr:hypothetical protein [Thermoanaerobaculia bacterium]